MIKAILFDMDGVLVDARDWHYQALNRALELFGMSIDRDAHLSTFDGLPTRAKLQILAKSRNLPASLHELIGRMKQAYTIEIAVAQCKPVFQIQYALANLRQSNYRMAVCSNSIRSTVETLMRLSRLDLYMDLMLSNEDVARPKPDPEMYLEAIKRLGLDSRECLIVEDNENGIKAARASGAHVHMVGTPEEVTLDRMLMAIRECGE